MTVKELIEELEKYPKDWYVETDELSDCIHISNKNPWKEEGSAIKQFVDEEHNICLNLYN